MDNLVADTFLFVLCRDVIGCAATLVVLGCGQGYRASSARSAVTYVSACRKYRTARTCCLCGLW